jgi:hypothetical protein
VINLRYHIISITAVFLALGIGLTLGSSFLDRVTVDNLQSRLTRVEKQVEDTRDENKRLQDQVSNFQKREDALAAQLPEQLLSGHLDGVPLLVLATKGTDDALVNRTIAALTSSGAQVSGTWWLTDKWALSKRGDVDSLGALLDLKSKDADRLRRNTAIRVADLLTAASAAAPATTDPSPSTTVSPPAEPAVIAALVKAGFVDYASLPGAAEHRVLLPAAGTRYVIVSDDAPGAGAQGFAAALLDELSAEPHLPVVAAQGQVDLPDTASGPASEDRERTTFVGAIRQGELTRTKISTIDDLDTPEGLAALVLALEDAGEGTVGHFGVASGAARLLPEPGPTP